MCLIIRGNMWRRLYLFINSSRNPKDIIAMREFFFLGSCDDDSYVMTAATWKNPGIDVIVTGSFSDVVPQTPIVPQRTPLVPPLPCYVSDIAVYEMSWPILLLHTTPSSSVSKDLLQLLHILATLYRADSPYNYYEWERSVAESSIML